MYVRYFLFSHRSFYRVNCWLPKSVIIFSLGEEEEANPPNHFPNKTHSFESDNEEDKRTMIMSPRWSGLETPGMKEARCSLLLQDESFYDAKIKSLPKQRVLVHQDKGFPHAPQQPSSPQREEHPEGNFPVDFEGATVLQLEPAVTGTSSMPVTLTVGGRCTFTPGNYQDFKVMMRTKDQSTEMSIPPNGNFDWPDVTALLVCPNCGKKGPVPRHGDHYHHEYWMVFYPMLQITFAKGSQLTLGTRTICRLMCLDCMEDILEGLTLKIRPGGSKDTSAALSFTLPASEVLAEAGSASFLEDGPPRPETHPHVDDVLDAWTLYNLWEHSGAWEALQNDYRLALTRSMSGEPTPEPPMEPKLKERMGKPCGNRNCGRVHGRVDEDGDMVRLSIKCKNCLSEFYCSPMCLEEAHNEHQLTCEQRQREREERRERKAKKVSCDTCCKKSPATKMKKCSRCRKATYCSIECQKSDWDRHRFECQKR